MININHFIEGYNAQEQLEKEKALAIAKEREPELIKAKLAEERKKRNKYIDSIQAACNDWFKYCEPNELVYTRAFVSRVLPLLYHTYNKSWTGHWHPVDVLGSFNKKDNLIAAKALDYIAQYTGHQYLKSLSLAVFRYNAERAAKSLILKSK